MAKLKIATFNIEWMISLFGAEWKDWSGQIPATFPGKRLGGIQLAKIEDVPALCRRIAGVIKAVDPRILGIQEGPPLKAQMELFVREYLDDKYIVHTSNSRTQTLHALVHKSIAARVSSFPHDGPETALLRAPIPFFPWGAIEPRQELKHAFDRRPLVLTFEPSPGKRLRIINVHAKSKFSKLKKPEQWYFADREAITDALLARQKLSAEILRLREYILKELRSAAASSDPCIVLGDFNDGPYRDVFEFKFLLHELLDKLVGSFLEPDSYFKHAMTPDALRHAATVSFPDPMQDGHTVEELIDHILVSPEIWLAKSPFRVKDGSCKVEMDAYQAFCAEGSDGPRGDRPSDHRPVSAVIQY